MTQHSSIDEKRIFDKVHFIYSKLFNQSVTFDYESKLIQYIAADELYEVTNKNKGIADKQYYQKQEYDEKSYFTLLTQMRVQGGNAYIDHVKDMLAGRCSSKYVSENMTLSFIQIFQNSKKICM